jgi:hypothetical protein
MTTCFRCGAETQLSDNETPVCVACMDAPAAQIKPTWDVTRLSNDMQLGLPHDWPFCPDAEIEPLPLNSPSAYQCPHQVEGCGRAALKFSRNSSRCPIREFGVLW